MKKEELTRTITISKAIKLGYEIRCGYSREGLDTFANWKGFRNKTGIITGESRNREHWRVKWDGTHYASVYHKSFIEPIFEK